MIPGTIKYLEKKEKKTFQDDVYVHFSGKTAATACDTVNFSSKVFLIRDGEKKRRQVYY